MHLNYIELSLIIVLLHQFLLIYILILYFRCIFSSDFEEQNINFKSHILFYPLSLFLLLPNFTSYILFEFKKKSKKQRDSQYNNESAGQKIGVKVNRWEYTAGTTTLWIKQYNSL